MSVNSLQRFFLFHASGAFATGIHIVLLAWLAVGVLHLSPVNMGVIQAVSLLPNLVFMLVAGALADRFDPAKVIANALALHVCAYFALAFLLFTDQLNFFYLAAYGAAVGTGNAFVQPVREKLLSSIETQPLQKRLSMASIVQFSFQSAGIVFASSAEWIGYAVIASVQGVIAATSLLTVLTIKKESVLKAHGISIKTDMVAGLNHVLRSQPLSQLMVLIGFNGYMHLGVYLVVLPLMAKTVYGFGAAEYGSLQLTFVLGMIAAHLNIVRQENIQMPGQGALFSLLYTAVIGFALAKIPTVPGFYFMIFCWGFVAGNSAGRCRLVLQPLVEEAVKGRVMSIYQFVLFGFAPLGALATGFFVKYLSIQQIFYFMSLSSVGIFLLFFVFGKLWQVEAAEKH